jgi:hypothetical protein
MQKMECKMTLFGMTVNKVAGVYRLQKIGWTVWLNKKDRKEFAYSKNVKFPFHCGIFPITSQFKCVLNIFAILIDMF